MMKQELGQSQEVSEDHCCPICLHVYYKPSSLPCKHIFCNGCLYEAALIGQSYNCPLCRGPFQREQIRNEPDLGRKMQELYPEALKEKMKAIQERVMARMVIGNTTNFRQTNQQNRYEWNFYIRPVEGDPPLSEHIRQIVVRLHETFNPNTRKFTMKGNKQVEIGCVGWGTFRILVEINWKAGYMENSTELHHDLRFVPVHERVVHTALTLKK